MKVKKITIKGTAYPFRITIGAMIQYKRMTGEDFSSFDGREAEKMCIIIFCGLRSECAAEGKEFPFEGWEEIADHLSLDDIKDLFGPAQEAGDGQDVKKN